ncbi:hypothetical protein AB0B66_40505 [Catellatospora sp. NPDC049111]|uniref:hypothetical protein n=1 Tax=Catellatospora sp. NPDC049111 TaxID=3155271 RepID=UPI0033CB49B9
MWRLAGPLAESRVIIDSCPDCFAWGVTRTYGWRCVGCRHALEEFKNNGPCASCSRAVVVLPNGHCRLCHKQRMMIARQAGRLTRNVSFAEAIKHGHQLYFAGMWHFEQGHGKIPYRKKTVPPDMSLLRPVDWQQLVLFDWPRDLKAGLRNGFPLPPDPQLEAAFHQVAREHAQRFGWSQSKAERVQRGIRVMLAIQDTPGAAIRRSDVLQLSRIKHSAATVADVIAAAGMLDDDIAPPVVRWFHANTRDLPEPMRQELTVWMDVMMLGSTTAPRRNPRSHTCIHNYIRWAMPTLRRWADTHHSLREVGRDDVANILAPNGLQRSTVLIALRSIFKILKGRKLVFINPCARLSAPQDRKVPDPVDLRQLRNSLNSDDPTTAALAALLAFHAVRLWQLRAMRLTDLHDGRLHIGEQVIVLAEPVTQRLAAYLDYRTNTWPTTINPHLFIHRRSWMHDRPVTPWWLHHQLGMSGQLIRQDRILDEAHASSGDLRMLCELFGLSATGAMRYIATVNSPDRGGTYRA